MSLREELQSRHARLLASMDDIREARAELVAEERAVLLELDDVQRAIGALQPPPPEAPVTDDALLDHQLEAEEPEFASEPLTTEEVAEVAEFISTLTGDPAIEPESGLHGERIEDVSQAETATEQTLIADEIPSIPREEIPIGAAVETYTDAGIETVKLAGTTYLVDDEPAPPVVEAAYAPVNDAPTNEALMWSNGFEADAKAKAEAAEQDKRPFWMFAKGKVDA